MAVLGAFVSSTLGMLGQARALNTIGVNVANVNTGGYKRNDTHFKTILSDSIDAQSNLGGIATKDYQRVSQQGRLIVSAVDTDVAITGNGFIIVKTPGGETQYTRDGSFQVTSGDDVSATADDGSTITVKEGLLADKNGNFVQGFLPDPVTGVFPASGSLSNLRVDQFAFSQTFLATTTADLDLNLPAGDDAGNKQVNLVALTGTAEAGDQFSVTVNGTTVSYTVATGDNINSIRDALVAAVNGNATIAASVAASASTISGALRLTAKEVGATFTSSAGTVNVALGVADNAVTSTTVQNASPSSDAHAFAIDVIDSQGDHQAVTLNFIKVAENTWNLTTTNSQTAVAQVDTVTLGGTVEAGDVYTVSINGNGVSYTVTGLEADINAVRNGIVNAINGNASVNSVVTAAAGGAGALTLTAKTAGTAFTSTASTTQGPAAVAQVDTITIAGGVNAGDVVRATINGTNVDYTVAGGDATPTDIANGLIAAINGNGAVNGAVTASGGAGGVVTITADVAGTPFTLASSVPTDPGLDTTATAANVTANVAVFADNTATKATTTANVPPTVTSAPTTLTFDGLGQLQTPAAGSLSLALAFKAGATASFTLDISGVTQFAGSFLPFNSQSNGFAAALLTSFEIDSQGRIVGNFDDRTRRAIYKLPLATFTNPDGLERRNGNTFVESPFSGAAVVRVAGEEGAGSFLGNALELSNVRLEDEFSKLIITQNAYNSSATVFRTIDEMTTVARDLKR